MRIARPSTWRLRCPWCGEHVRWLPILVGQVPLLTCEVCYWMGRRGEAAR